ncbi:hypothetical protein WJX72_009856 [[Myrmecia] bisecta]|uniref:dolichyl-phosphate beta-glucosyltransferase n=1 Tax=[Myrmecia] bisecta TaxID=41462 RepID=A0AAW1PHZ5_9CHLO
MATTALIGLLVVALLVFVGKSLWDWFTRLEGQAECKSSELVLENPVSVQKAPCPSIYGEATKSLSIVIPAYNEAARLPATLDETLVYLQRRRDRQGPHFTYEVIIVDDGSTDDTVRVAFDYVRKYGFDAVRVLRLPSNRGKGYAVKVGMMIARGELLLFMDADGATRVSDVERLEQDMHKLLTGTPDAPVAKTKLGAAGLAMSVGSRAHMEQQAIAKRTWARNFLMHGFHFLVMFVAGGAVRDTQCGFKLFTRRAARTLFTNQRLQRWCFDVELIYLAKRLGIPIAETAVNWTEIPGSKIKITSMIHMAWELVAILVGYFRLWHIRTEAELTKTRS